MGGRGIGGLKTRVGQKFCIGRGEARLYSGGIQTGGVRRESHSVIRRSREAPGVRAATSPKFGEGKL